MSGNDFLYRSGQPGSYHGDDRLARRNSAYAWFFRKTASYYFHAWLANVAFTDPRAEYRVYEIVNWMHLSTINQNTAPSGWNYLGFGYGMELLVKRSSGVGATGADAVRAHSVGSSTAGALALEREPARCASLRPRDPKLAELQARMLDTAQRYETASGRYEIAFSNNGQHEMVDFEVSQRERASFVRVTDHEGIATEFVSDGRSLMTLHPQRAAYTSVKLAPAASRAQGPRMYRNASCEPVFVHVADGSGAFAAADVLAPGNYAFWLSQPGGRIVGSERLFGRDVTVVEGRHDHLLARKLGAASFKMWVDAATGALLRLRGTDGAGRQMYAIEVDDIRFDQAAPLQIAMLAPAGWIRLDGD